MLETGKNIRKTRKRSRRHPAPTAGLLPLFRGFPYEICRFRFWDRLEWQLSGYRTLTDVAHQFGFSSGQHISHVFRKITGIAPTQFVKENRGEKV